MRCSVFAMSAAIFSTANAEYKGPAALDADVAWTVTGEFCEPETVLSLPDDTFLVSNVCGYSADGTGFLTHIDAAGVVTDWRIVDELDSPLGMAMLDDKLYVVDRNSVRTFTWPGFEPSGIIELSTRVANDLAVAEDGTIYISDSAAAAVTVVHPDGVSEVLDSGIDFTNANGLALDGDTLLIGGQRLWRYALQSGDVTTIGEAWLSDIDGIELEADGVLQAAPVGGPVVRLFADGRVQVLGGEGVSSANHGYSPTLGLVVVPTGFDNTVIALRIPAD